MSNILVNGVDLVNIFQVIINPPTGLTFIGSTTTSVTFSFTAPTCNVTNYIPYIDGSEGTGSGTTASYTITSLSANTTYSITMVTNNMGTVSSQSVSANMSTLP